MSAMNDVAFTAARQLISLQFTNTIGEPDSADALAHIEDGEALVRIFDQVVMAWAREAASSLPGNFRDGLDAMENLMSNALYESDFMCELRAVRERLGDARSYGDAHRSQRTHAGVA